MAGNHRARKSARLFDGNPVMVFREEADRRMFLKGAGIIGVGATFVAVSHDDPRAFAQGSASDLEILNYALTLEYIEADFYTQGIAGGTLFGRELELIMPIREHEQQHVTVLTDTIKQLGGTPVEKPMLTYPVGTFVDKTMFLTTASMFEELGVDAYHGQIANVQSPEILSAAAAIAGVESRHAAILADLSGGNPFPAPFEDSKTKEDVLESANHFIQA